jgi:hypothetical protein
MMLVGEVKYLWQQTQQRYAGEGETAVNRDKFGWMHRVPIRPSLLCDTALRDTGITSILPLTRSHRLHR